MTRHSLYRTTATLCFILGILSILTPFWLLSLFSFAIGIYFLTLVKERESRGER